MSELDDVYSKYNKLTNMSYSELKKWSENPLSRKASIGISAINRNLRLKRRRKDQWTTRDIKDANKAISYISRAKEIRGSNYVGDSGLTRNDIALRNWAYNTKQHIGF